MLCPRNFEFMYIQHLRRILLFHNMIFVGITAFSFCFYFGIVMLTGDRIVTGSDALRVYSSKVTLFHGNDSSSEGESDDESSDGSSDNMSSDDESMLLLI